MLYAHMGPKGQKRRRRREDATTASLRHVPALESRAPARYKAPQFVVALGAPPHQHHQLKTALSSLGTTRALLIRGGEARIISRLPSIVVVAGSRLFNPPKDIIPS